MKKLVFVSDVIPDPDGTGSEQRAYSLLLAYSKFILVELWCYPRPDNPSVKRIYKLVGLVSDIFVYFPSLFCSNEAISARLAAALKNADAVHVAKLAVKISHPHIIWDIDELPPSFRQPFLPHIAEEPTKRLDPIVNEWVNFSRNCAFVTCSSPLECTPFISNMEVVPNCYSHQRIDITRRKTKTLLFVGHLGYPPNVEAVAYFCKEVLVRLPAEYRFRVVGKKPLGRINLAALEAIAHDPRVDILFDVENCSHFYEDALALVVPLLQGTGTRYKVLEAFAHECPVVTTSKGCEGYQVAHREHLLICDAPEDFANACEELCADDELSARLVASARAYLLDFHSQRSLEATLRDCIIRRLPFLLEE
jgi:glycosyltransferase involved in cell wall biosynthesis